MAEYNNKKLDGKKWCNRCNQLKDAGLFTWNGASHRYCKDCYYEERKIYKRRYDLERAEQKRKKREEAKIAEGLKHYSCYRINCYWYNSITKNCKIRGNKPKDCKFHNDDYEIAPVNLIKK